jgi:hypothetical protein
MARLKAATTFLVVFYTNVLVDFLNRKLEGQGLLVRPVRRHRIEACRPPQ